MSCAFFRQRKFSLLILLMSSIRYSSSRYEPETSQTPRGWATCYTVNKSRMIEKTTPIALQINQRIQQCVDWMCIGLRNLHKNICIRSQINHFSPLAEKMVRRTKEDWYRVDSVPTICVVSPSSKISYFGEQ